jgi:hypothetical protein
MFIPLWILALEVPALIYLMFLVARCPVCELRTDVEKIRRTDASYREHGLSEHAIPMEQKYRELEKQLPEYAELQGLRGQILSAQSRIEELEEDLQNHSVPIPFGDIRDRH